MMKILYSDGVKPASRGIFRYLWVTEKKAGQKIVCRIQQSTGIAQMQRDDFFSPADDAEQTSAQAAT